MVTIALAKGRLADYTTELFARCGVDTSELRKESRRLVLHDKKNGMRFILVKPSDVPVYVYHGVADIGIAGKDTLLEAGLPLYEMLDLAYGGCVLAVAGYPDGGEADAWLRRRRVATKYPRVAQMYYEEKGEDIELIMLHGSIELAPVLGLSDVIVDIVESGKTLRENGLCVLEEICPVSARLVVNQVSLKTKDGEILPFIDNLREALGEKG